MASSVGVRGRGAGGGGCQGMVLQAPRGKELISHAPSPPQVCRDHFHTRPAPEPEGMPGKNVPWHQDTCFPSEVICQGTRWGQGEGTFWSPCPLLS